MVWTAERITELTRLAPHFTAEQISRRLGVTRNAVIGKSHRLGITIGQQQKSLAERQAARVAYLEAYNERRRSMPIQRPAPMPVPTIAPPSRDLSVLELEIDDCRWPITDNPPHLFCGNLKVPGLSYCPFHARRAVQ